MQPATTVSDDENEDKREKEAVVRAARHPEVATMDTSKTLESNVMDFNLDGSNSERIPEVNIIEEDVQNTNLAAELLWIHHRMGHAPFAKLQERGHTIKTEELPNSNVHSLCIREGEQKSLEGKANKESSRRLEGSATRRNDISRSDGLAHTGLSCATHRGTYHEKVQLRNRIRGPGNQNGIRAPAEGSNSRRNVRRKRSV
jgi:hypothetical protein